MKKSNIEAMLEFNRKFVENKEYKNYSSEKVPSKKIAILSCMDARLTEILQDALNLKNGEAHVIKNAGAVISHPFGSVMRSLLVAVYQLEVEDIVVIGHYDCGMQGLDCSKLTGKMLERGIEKEELDFVSRHGVDLSSWLRGFEKVEDAVRDSCSVIKRHPLIPKDVRIHGFIMDPVTGKLDKIE